MSKLFKNKYGLSVNELIELHSLYEAHSTAEYLMDNYDIEDVDKAIKLGYEIRNYMDKYGVNECSAIDAILAKRS